MLSSLRLILLAGSLVLPAFSSNPAQAQQPAAQGWESFPTMILEQIYRGPLRDTVIQRWRDPVNSTICYLYLPISTPLVASQPGSNFVQYGPNNIGGISCINPTQLVQIAPAPQAAPEPARPAAPAPARPATPPASR